MFKLEVLLDETNQTVRWRATTVSSIEAATDLKEWQHEQYSSSAFEEIVALVTNTIDEP